MRFIAGVVAGVGVPVILSQARVTASPPRHLWAAGMQPRTPAASSSHHPSRPKNSAASASASASAPSRAPSIGSIRTSSNAARAGQSGRGRRPKPRGERRYAAERACTPFSFIDVADRGTSQQQRCRHQHHHRRLSSSCISRLRRGAHGLAATHARITISSSATATATTPQRRQHHGYSSATLQVSSSAHKQLPLLIGVPNCRNYRQLQRRQRPRLIVGRTPQPASASAAQLSRIIQVRRTHCCRPCRLNTAAAASVISLSGSRASIGTKAAASASAAAATDRSACCARAHRNCHARSLRHASITSA